MQRTTKNFRLALDVELRYPHDAEALIALADVVEDVVREMRSVARVRWFETTAVEPDFDYGEWNNLMAVRRAER